MADMTCLWRFIFCLLVFLMDVLPVEGSNSSTLLQLLCTTSRCRNGMCYTLHTRVKCACGELFYGNKCERINMGAVRYDSIGTMAIFYWPSPPRLKGYTFVYYEMKENLVPKLEKLAVTMKENEDAATLSNLYKNGATYRVCVEDEMVAELIVRQNSYGLLRDCVTLKTYQGYFTLAGYGIAGLLAIAALLLMYSQKGKIEILYYNRSYKSGR